MVYVKSNVQLELMQQKRKETEKTYNLICQSDLELWQWMSRHLISIPLPHE